MFRTSSKLRSLFYFSSKTTKIINRNMTQGALLKLLSNAEKAESRLSQLKSQLEALRKIKIQLKIQELTKENIVLATKVESVKAELIKLEVQNGKKQYPIPGKTVSISAAETALNTEGPEIPVTKEKKEKQPAAKKEKTNNAQAANNSPVDVRKLDFRIGKIVEINKHPDADSLYVEKIDCGEENPRTVVSGLVNHVPIAEMKDRIVMVLCNLKPVKMRGVTSEAMVMCASSPDKVEVLVPPSGAVPGDLVSCEGFPREPEPQLNPKKKIFETCAPDLKTNDDKVACYKDQPLIIPGKGPVVAPTLKGVSVK